MSTKSTASAIRREFKQERPYRSTGGETFSAILRTAEVLRRQMTRLVEPAGVSLQQYNVLRILRGAHPSSLPTLEIRERLIEQAAGITRLVDALDDAGLIQRERGSEDRRLVHCTITDAGLQLLRDLEGVIDAADDAIVDGIPAPHVEVLLETLGEIRARITGG